MKRHRHRGERNSAAPGKTAYEELVSRQERKQRTRESLMDAALTLMSQGRTFGSLEPA